MNITYRLMYVGSRKMVWWSYLQGRSRDTDIKDRWMDTKGEGWGGENGETSIDTYTPLILWRKQETNEDPLYREVWAVPCGDLDGEEIHERGGTCVCEADSLGCTIETNKTLWRNYTPIKIKEKIQSCYWKVKKIFQSTILGKHS